MTGKTPFSMYFTVCFIFNILIMGVVWLVLSHPEFFIFLGVAAIASLIAATVAYRKAG